jgi:hypothetical protein
MLNCTDYDDEDLQLSTNESPEFLSGLAKPFRITSNMHYATVQVHADPVQIAVQAGSIFDRIVSARMKERSYGVFLPCLPLSGRITYTGRK